MAEINVPIFLTHKTKKMNNIKKEYNNFAHKLGKLASNLKMNYTKMGKSLKSEKV